MRIVSDITGKSYDTVDDCLAAEEEYNKALAERKAKAEEKAANRKAKAKEVQEAYENYHKKLKEFCKEYGPYHMTINGEELGTPTLFDLMEKLLEF